MRCRLVYWSIVQPAQRGPGPDRGAARAWAWCTFAVGCAAGPLEPGGERVGAWPHVVDGGELAGVLVRLAQADDTACP